MTCVMWVLSTIFEIIFSCHSLWHQVGENVLRNCEQHLHFENMPWPPPLPYRNAIDYVARHKTVLGVMWYRYCVVIGWCVSHKTDTVLWLVGIYHMVLVNHIIIVFYSGVSNRRKEYVSRFWYFSKIFFVKIGWFSPFWPFCG